MSASRYDQFEPSAVVKVLKNLVTPSNDSSHSDETNVSTDASRLLSWSFKANIIRASAAYESLLQSAAGSQQSVTDLLTSSDSLDSDGDITWLYVACNIKLLLILKTSLDAAQLKHDTKQFSEKSDHADTKVSDVPVLYPSSLSLEESSCVSKSVQLIVAFGICPNLVAGVGVPLDRRSACGELAIYMSSLRNVEGRIRELRLLACIEALVDCSALSSLAELILSRHLNDIIAGLCQLIYHPKKTIDDASVTRCHKNLGELLGRVSQPVLIGELLLLQNGTPPSLSRSTSTPPSSHISSSSSSSSSSSPSVTGPQDTTFSRQSVKRPPMWLRKACTTHLIQQFMRSNGVIAVFQCLLQQDLELSVSKGSGGRNHFMIDWQKCEAVARLIVDCPIMDSNISVNNYFENIGAQILVLLQRDLDDEVLRVYLRLVVTVISSLLTRQPVTTQSVVIDPLLSPLLSCLQCAEDEEMTQEKEVVSETSLSQCINNIYKMCICCTESQSCHLVNAMKSVVDVLFTLYTETKDGISHLKSRVEEIIQWIFKNLELTTALEYLEKLAGSSDTEQLMRGSDTDCRLGGNDSDAHRFTERLAWMSTRLQFTPGSDGGMRVVTKSATILEESLEGSEILAINIVSILVSLKRSDGLVSRFFIHCLKALTRLVSREVQSSSSPDDPLSDVCRRLLTCDTTVTHVTLAALKQNLTLLALIGAMCEQLGEECLKNAQDIIEFVQATLERSLTILGSAVEEEEMNAFETETVTLAMLLMTTIITDKQYSSKVDWLLAGTLIPLLRSVSHAQRSSEDVKEMALDLSIIIATHGFVRPDPKHVSNNTSNTAKTSVDSSNTGRIEKELKYKNTNTSHLKAVHKLIEEIPLPEINTKRSYSNSECVRTLTKTIPQTHGASFQTPQSSASLYDTLTPVANGQFGSLALKDQDCEEKISCDKEVLQDCNPKSNHSKEFESRKQFTSTDYVLSQYRQALVESCDPLIPVRGHGLIILRRLLEDNDSETLENAVTVLRLCRECLAHSDSYIYLNAVQALAELGGRRPALVLPYVAEDYAGGAGCGGVGEERVGGSLTSELRMKLGEVLVKMTSSLGEVVPHYRFVLLNCMLAVTKDPDPLLRASAVSNLGQICSLLHFSLGNVLYEVFSCIHGLLKNDSNVEVRRSAAMFSSLLLRGLGKDTLKVLGGVLLDLYRLLKYTLIVDKDNVVHLHVQLAIEELDDIVKQFMFPKPTYTKRIHVLDPFDNDI